MAPLYDVSGHPLLSGAFAGLVDISGGATGNQQRTAINEAAEMELGLTSPAYTGDAADRLKYAVALEINFLLKQGIEPVVMSGITDNRSGATTSQYRNRAVNPEAAQIVEQVTGRKPVRLSPRSRLT